MFNILDYADQLEFVKETNTQLTYRCPVCFAKLQVSKRNSAYMCVASCTASDIRRNMDIPSRSNYQKPLYVPPIPIPIPRQIKLHKCDVKYDLVKQSFFHTRYNEEVNKIVYDYSPEHRVIRLELTRSKEKLFYPNRKVNDKWEILADDNHPFFNENLIRQKNVFITLVEGEKCAVALSEQGILSITPPPFGWSENRLQQGFERLYYDIDGILVIPDNDMVGLKKAVRVQNACWRVGLPCRILNLESYYQNEKEDVYDLIQRGLDMVNVIHNLL